MLLSFLCSVLCCLSVWGMMTKTISYQTCLKWQINYLNLNLNYGILNTNSPALMIIIYRSLRSFCIKVYRDFSCTTKVSKPLCCLGLLLLLQNDLRALVVTVQYLKQLTYYTHKQLLFAPPFWPLNVARLPVGRVDLYSYYSPPPFTPEKTKFCSYYYFIQHQETIIIMNTFYVN